MIWMTADWNVPQGLIVIHDLLDVFHLLEVSPSNSGNCLAVSIMSTNGGSNPQTSQPWKTAAMLIAGAGWSHPTLLNHHHLNTAHSDGLEALSPLSQPPSSLTKVQPWWRLEIGSGLAWDLWSPSHRLKPGLVSVFVKILSNNRYVFGMAVPIFPIAVWVLINVWELLCSGAFKWTHIGRVGTAHDGNMTSIMCVLWDVLHVPTSSNSPHAFQPACINNMRLSEHKWLAL